MELLHTKMLKNKKVHKPIYITDKLKYLLLVSIYLILGSEQSEKCNGFTMVLIFFFFVNTFSHRNIDPIFKHKKQFLNERITHRMVL